jgi:UDP-N-acetylmuramate--alanine ligase
MGSGEFFVIEGDESDGSHLITEPFAAILTSVDVDHLAFWKNGENLLASYKEFISKVKSKESFLYFGDDEVLTSLQPIGKSYGFNKGCDFCVEITSLELDKTTFSINGTPFSLKMFGSYNCLNAAAVFGLLDSLGVCHQKIREAFSSFKGVMRRMEYVGYDIYSDYAHHPSEVRAVLRDLEGVHGDVQIIFEPHRLSRFKDELDGFCEVFKEIVITDIFEASEGLFIDPKPLLEIFCKKTNSLYVPLGKIETYLSENKRKTLVIGAGPIDQMLRNYINKYSEKDS